MPITIELNEKQLHEKLPLEMHFLPAKISGDGDANIEEYFNKYTRTNDLGVLTNALRGFPLLGEQLNVPKGYKAVVLQENDTAAHKDAERKLRITGTFDKFSYWNYDKTPSEGDAYKQTLHMLQLAEVLAKPITEAEVLEEMEEQRKRKAKKEKENKIEND